MRRSIFGLALVAVLCAPARVDAQAWCVSPTSAFCFNVTGFQFVGAPGDTQVTWGLAGYWFGSSIPGLNPSSVLWAHGLQLSTTSGLFSAQSTTQVGSFFGTVISTVSLPTGSTLTRTSTLEQDAWFIGLFPQGFTNPVQDALALCSPNGSFASLGINACYAYQPPTPPPVPVPAPGSFLLMATGLLGIAFAARRRTLEVA